MAEEPENPTAGVEAPEATAANTKPKAAPRKKAPVKDAEAAKEAPAAEGAPVAPVAPTAEAPAPAADGAQPAVAAAASTQRPKAAKAKKTVKKEEAPAAAPVSISLDDTIEPVKVIKAKGSKNISHGIAHVLATFNNTIVSITDARGAVLGWSSAGKCGFKGSRKSTAYAAQVVAQDACKQAMGHGVREVEVRVKGPGSGRESAVRAMQAVGLDITVIRDVTPVPHNGCRPPKQRRV